MPSRISDIIKEHLPSLEQYEPLYKHLHANPELSFQEKETASRIATELSKFSIDEVHTDIGGHGIAAVIKNGPGKIVLLRADFDALPVEEKTGLEYASKKKMKDAEGVEKPVMHACGHDMHVTCLLAATELMTKAKDTWSGTLILCFQPAEERGAGAVSDFASLELVGSIWLMQRSKLWWTMVCTTRFQSRTLYLVHMSFP